MTSTTLPFGKYEGEDVCALVDADRNYAVWMFSQPWFRLQHPTLFSALRRRLAKRLAADVAEEDDVIDRAAARDMLPPAERYKFVSAAELGRVEAAAAITRSAALADARANLLRARAREAERIRDMLLDAATVELAGDLV